MYERIDPNFEPTATTLESGLFVRKKSSAIAGVTHPGLHGVHGVAIDVSVTILVLILEAVGMFMLIQALTGSEVAIDVLLGGAFFAVLADFALAYFHHRFSTGYVTKMNVKKVVISQESATDQRNLYANIESDSKSKSWIAFIFTAAIILFAVLKFIIYFSSISTQMGEDIEYTAIAAAFLIYIIAAYIHVNHTGYALAWFKGSVLYGRDVKAFRGPAGLNRAQSRRIKLKNLKNFEMAPKVGEHRLKLETIPGEEEKSFVLTTHGLLLDSEIEEFVNQLTDPEAKRELALKAMDLQLRYLNA